MELGSNINDCLKVYSIRKGQNNIKDHLFYDITLIFVTKIDR